MRVAAEFERFADSYSEHNIIQRIVANRLISMIDTNRYGNRYLDIGCGEGAVYKNLLSYNIPTKHFLAVDISPSMLRLHPESQNIKKIEGDFNTPQLYQNLKKYNIDTVISASSLQWSQDIDWTLKNISYLAPNVAFAIFTDATFADVLNTLNISSPIHSSESILNALLKYYMPHHLKIENITMTLKNSKDILSYIKKSGVSGSRAVLTYKEIKRFIDSYNKNLLEFQIIYFTGHSRVR